MLPMFSHIRATYGTMEPFLRLDFYLNLETAHQQLISSFT